jgi:hypothetical protein
MSLPCHTSTPHSALRFLHSFLDESRRSGARANDFISSKAEFCLRKAFGQVYVHVQYMCMPYRPGVDVRDAPRARQACRDAKCLQSARVWVMPIGNRVRRSHQKSHAHSKALGGEHRKQSTRFVMGRQQRLVLNSYYSYTTFPQPTASNRTPRPLTAACHEHRRGSFLSGRSRRIDTCR